MEQWRDRWNTGYSNSTPDLAVGRRGRVLERVRLVPPVIPVIFTSCFQRRGQLAADAAHVAAAHSEYVVVFIFRLSADISFSERATRQWAALAQEWYSYELGADSEQVATMLALLENPRRHYAWGTRERINVQMPSS